MSRLQARLQKRGLVRKTADAKGGAPSSAPAAAAAQGGYVCRQAISPCIPLGKLRLQDAA